MSERERWIVYPLLFLALGAALRDKIIKSTESQRIKSQGLYVFDELNNQPILVLGADQFPELRPGYPNMVKVQSVESGDVRANSVTTSNVIATKSIHSGDMTTKNLTAEKSVAKVIRAETVIANNYVLTDGQNSIRLNGDYTVTLTRFIHFLRAQFQGQQKVQKVAPVSNPSQDPPAASEETSKPPSPPTLQPPASTTPPATEAAVNSVESSATDPAVGENSAPQEPENK